MVCFVANIANICDKTKENSSKDIQANTICICRLVFLFRQVFRTKYLTEYINILSL